MLCTQDSRTYTEPLCLRPTQGAVIFSLEIKVANNVDTFRSILREVIKIIRHTEDYFSVPETGQCFSSWHAST